MADLPNKPASREEAYLANAAGQDVQVPPCPYSRKEAYLDAIGERINDLQDEIEELENNPDVVDIVDTYTDLQAYDTSTLTDKDVIRVLNDETHDGNSTYYRFDKATNSFTYIGSSKAYDVFVGTDGTSAGEKGLVPAPATTDAGKYLKSDGTWGAVNVAQSDWYETDTDSPAYIKNRTHYDTLHKKYYPDDSATYTPSFPSVNGVAYNSNDPSAWLNELGSQWAVLDPQGINPAYSPVAIDTSYGRIQASKDIHYMEMEDVSWLREGMTGTDIVCKGSPMFVSEADFERVWYSNGFRILHKFTNVENGHTIFASSCVGTSGQGFSVWFIDNQMIIASDKQDSSTNYVYFKSATGTLKELDSKYLPAATSDKKGAIKLSEVGDAVAVGEGLKKYTNGQGLTELAIADGGTADYEESDSSATTYIQNRPFYDGTSVTKSINLGPKYSVYWNTSSTYYSGIETWLTSSMGSAYFSIDGGVRVVKSDGNFFAPDEEFVTAIINGGQVDMTLTYEDMMMMTTTEYHLTNLTFTKINDAAYGTEFIGATWRDGHFRPILVRADVAARLSGGSLIPYTVDDGWFLFMAYNLNGYLQLDSIYSAGTNEATFTLTTPIKQLDAKYVPIDGTTIVNDNGVLKASGGPTVVQTTGTSTTDVMSQDATTKMVYGSSYGGTRQGIYINPSTGVVRNVFLGGWDNAGTATEIFATLGGEARNTGVVTFGRMVSGKGVFNIQTIGSTNGYNNSNYRLLTGLYDPQSAHDAATKGYVDGTTETLTIADTDWAALSSSSPYTYSATVTVTATIGANSTVSLINDSAVDFATYGFAIGSVDQPNNTVTIYSIGAPSASKNLTINVKG